MDPVIARIEAWQRAGLIDSVTADRLRADEASLPPDQAASSADKDAPLPGAAMPSSPASGPTGSSAARPGYLAISSVFGPGVTIGEMFGYLGTGFLVGAWSAFVLRLAGPRPNSTMIGGGALIAAVGLVVLALALGTTDHRRRRAAGVALVVAVVYVVAAAGGLIADSRFDPYLIAMVVTAAAMGAAAAFRLLLPSLLTTIALLASVTSFGWAVLAFVVSVIAPRVNDFTSASTPSTLLPRILVDAVGWLVLALILGILAIVEDGSAADAANDLERPAAARRRSTLIRAWAGVVAVWGLASAVAASTYDTDTFEQVRVIPAWIGDAAILVLAMILVERAFRRDSGAFLFAAGIGFATALTDLNFSYLTDSRDIGLLAEGGILLAVGFGAERLRRRMPGGRPPAPPTDGARPDRDPISRSLTPPTQPPPEPIADGAAG